MRHYVVDLGNSRLKVAYLDPTGALRDRRAFAIHEPADWEPIAAWIGQSVAPSRWSIASVNPPAAERFAVLVRETGPDSLGWYTSAADVPIAHNLERPEATGADRALAVRGGRVFGTVGSWGLIVSCGTAITIERVLDDGTWDGGVIAPGLALGTRSLRRETALLPLVDLKSDVPFWGRSTVPAIESGVFWGTVGALKELIARQRDSPIEPWVVWTGGDAERLARHVIAGTPTICPDLVLQGLALMVRGETTGERKP
jgi:type III pantothenate kinase